jgi:hypothetical protein
MLGGKLIETAIVWVVDYFKIRSPKIYAVVAVALVLVAGVLTETATKGGICLKGWEELVDANYHVTAKPGEVVNLNTIDSTVFWSSDTLVTMDHGGISTFVYETIEGEFGTLAVNTCFVKDDSGLAKTIAHWISLIALALFGVHTSDRKRELQQSKS